MASLGLPEKVFNRRPKIADDVESHESGVYGEARRHPIDLRLFSFLPFFRQRSIVFSSVPLGGNYIFSRHVLSFCPGRGPRRLVNYVSYL
jgi:hypothetical protein